MRYGRFKRFTGRRGMPRRRSRYGVRRPSRSRSYGARRVRRVSRRRVGSPRAGRIGYRM